jgi:RNA polymerase-binding transcription factor DksA
MGTSFSLLAEPRPDDFSLWIKRSRQRSIAHRRRRKAHARSALADDEALAGTDEVLRHEIADIRQALLRIERDEYGSCASCGAEISEGRLEALPTATLCIKCAP